LEIPTIETLKTRTNAVLNAIYLLFNEGYNSTHSEELIRNDLIDEAMILGRLLTENQHTQLPETYALMGLMCFHAARNKARLTTEGEIILLSDQNRMKWDQELISQGNDYMNKSTFGDCITTYHIEAAIVFEHCLAESFEKTNWKRILRLYDWLLKIAPSPITELNRAVIIMQLHGPLEALETLDNIPDKKRIENFYLYHSLLGEIYSRLNNPDKSKQAFESALVFTKSDTEKKLLQAKIKAIK
jgi:RNA polymerase sigma-70 factor (ECF subfamily)